MNSIPSETPSCPLKSLNVIMHCNSKETYASVRESTAGPSDSVCGLIGPQYHALDPFLYMYFESHAYRYEQVTASLRQKHPKDHSNYGVYIFIDARSPPWKHALDGEGPSTRKYGNDYATGL
jgi:hypothetical protein